MDCSFRKSLSANPGGTMLNAPTIIHHHTESKQIIELFKKMYSINKMAF